MYNPNAFKSFYSQSGLQVIIFIWTSQNSYSFCKTGNYYYKPCTEKGFIRKQGTANHGIHVDYLSQPMLVLHASMDEWNSR